MYGASGEPPSAVIGCTDDAGPQGGGTLDSAPFILPITNFWQAEPISRASPTMAECAETYLPARPAMAAE